MTRGTHTKTHRTAVVPVTTMEELPISSEEARAEMVASLKAAEGRIAAGQYVEHDSMTFVDHLMDVRATANGASDNTEEDVLIQTKAARAELLASHERGEEDAKAGRVKRMSVIDFKGDMRADFERIIGKRLP